MNTLKTITVVAFIFTFMASFSQENTKNLELKVLQINAWHGTTAVADGFKGLVSVVEQTDADIVLLCEIQGNHMNVVNRLVDTLQVIGKKYYGESGGGTAGVISKYPMQRGQPCCSSDAQGPMSKVHVSIAGNNLTVYSAHLDYLNYACYLPRGYSGTNWKKMETPVLNADSVLRANRLSQRDESILAFVEDAKAEISRGNLVLLGGDFNEPSHLDWQADTKDLRDHNGLIINWDCSVMLTDMGMVDTYRKKFPDAVQYPGITFPSANDGVPIEKLVWAADADDRDRIDFIYYHPHKAWSLRDVSIVGPEETIVRGKVAPRDSKDTFIVPVDVWPTDHKGNLATFVIQKN